jgi:hypothetical protein
VGFASTIDKLANKAAIAIEAKKFIFDVSLVE